MNYYGNVEIGKTIALDTLSNIYDAVVVSSGAPDDKNLSIDNKNYPIASKMCENPLMDDEYFKLFVMLILIHF